MEPRWSIEMMQSSAVRRIASLRASSLASVWVRSRTRRSSCSFACLSWSAPRTIAAERRASYAESSMVAVRMTKVKPPMVYAIHTSSRPGPGARQIESG